MGLPPQQLDAWGWYDTENSDSDHRRKPRGQCVVLVSDWKPRGHRVGWVSGDDLYLEPQASFAVAQRMARDTGEGLTVSNQTLRKRLKEKGLLKSTDTKRGRLVIRRTLEGARREVLHLDSNTLMPSEPAQVSHSALEGSQTPVNRDDSRDGSWDENAHGGQKVAHTNGPQVTKDEDVKDGNGKSGTIGPLTSEYTGKSPIKFPGIAGPVMIDDD